MYEFTDKKVREKFKKTAYGKKLIQTYERVVAVFAIFTFLLLIAYILNFSGIIGNDIMRFLIYPVVITGILAIYFDGKRDGALEQYKKIK